ncbi:MAG: transporter substrate-binding domain-containing protein [Eggerthellaceae bacterium]|nr:transporter substrate-binding domain-containing protein [Eggerthellaceae bacterium]
MKAFKTAAVVALAGVMVAAMCAMAGCAGNKLSVITSPDYPPYENLENGKYVGFDIELMEAIAKELGYSGVDWISMDFDAIVGAVAAGTQANVAISCFGIDPDRALLIDFTDPYVADAMAIVVLKTSDLADAGQSRITVAVNTQGFKVAVQSGTTCEDYVAENFPNATIVPFKDANDCYAAMQAGTVDAVCSNSSVAYKMVEVSYTNAKVVYTENTGEEYAIIVNKDQSDLKDKINAALAKLIDNGTVADLVDAWGL